MIRVLVIFFLLFAVGCRGGFHLYTGGVFQCPEELLEDVQKKMTAFSSQCNMISKEIQNGRGKGITTEQNNTSRSGFSGAEFGADSWDAQ